MSSCQSEVIEEENGPHIMLFGDVEIEVLRCVSPPACISLDPELGASVQIYYSEKDQESGFNVARSGLTDIDGKVRFNNLDSFMVYISVIQDTFRYKSFERAFPNTLSFHRVIIE